MATGLINPKVVWRHLGGLAVRAGLLARAIVDGGPPRTSELWEIPLEGTDTQEPVGHFAGQYGRLRSVAVTNDGDRLLITGSNTEAAATRKGDDRLLRVTG